MKFFDSLSHYILDNTTKDIYWRGVDYAGKGRVKKLSELDKKLSATVVGSKQYNVEFRQGPKYIKGHCNCPYASSNDDYCKHIVALAVAWDVQRQKKLPTEKEIQETCIEIDYGFGSKIEKMYSDPLGADLNLLAAASDYGSWVRPHAKILTKSYIRDSSEKLTIKEAHFGLGKILFLENRANYDPYFCAGEVSAVLCLTYDAIIKRVEHLSLDEFKEILVECVVFYYNKYLVMIDGSDGVWKIPQARIIKMLRDLEERGLAKKEKRDLGKVLNAKISGWGNILEDLNSDDEKANQN